MRRFILILSVLCLTLPIAAQRKAFNLQPGTTRPFSDAILVGDTLYLAGHMGFDSKGELPASFEDEARTALKGLGDVLKAAGFGYSDVVKVTVFVTDLKNFDTWNKVYGEFFKVDPPARSTVQVAALVRGGHVEVEMIAVKRKK